MLKKYKVSAYLQGHHHTMEHSHANGATDPTDISYFTIGAGALIEHGLVRNEMMGIFPENEACANNNPADHYSFCHFHWFTMTYTGAYAQMTTTPEGVKVEFIESDMDRL